MIKLSELLHSAKKENEDGLIAIDAWRWPDVDHLTSMGFEFGDDHHLITTKEPKISVYKRKEPDQTSGKSESYFYVEEKDRVTKRFKSFNDVIEYFDNYEQPELDDQK